MNKINVIIPTYKCCLQGRIFSRDTFSNFEIKKHWWKGEGEGRAGGGEWGGGGIK